MTKIGLGEPMIHMDKKSEADVARPHGGPLHRQSVAEQREGCIHVREFKGKHRHIQ